MPAVAVSSIATLVTVIGICQQERSAKSQKTDDVDAEIVNDDQTEDPCEYPGKRRLLLI